MEGFIKYMRSEEAINLHSNRNANHLLSIIAFRASRKGNPVLGVKPGEAFIGDYKKIGFTHREYRSAITNLVKWGYVTTTTTNKGTIAKLCNSDVYDINSDLFDKQETNQRQTKDKQETNQRQTKDKQETTIKKERIKESKKERKKVNENFDIFSDKILANKYKQVKNDFQRDPFPMLRESKELTKMFCTWLVYRKADSIYEVDAHLKSFIKMIADTYTTESIVLAVDHAILNKHSSIHPKEKMANSMMGYLPEFKTGYEKKLYLRKRLMAYGQYAKKIEGFNHEYNCRYSRTLTKDNTNEYIKIINELDELFPILKEHK